MTSFSGNLLIIGCGAVAQCVIPLILKLIDINPSKIVVMDYVDHRQRIKESLEQGIQYVCRKITKENYIEVFSSYLANGDILLDLAWNLETAALMDWCHKQGVMYLNSSVEEWDPYADASNKKPTELTLYHRQMKLRKVMENWKKKGPTIIVDHGANPGLVSHFVKQGLIDLCTKIVEESSSSERRRQIEYFLEHENFPKLAQLSGLKTIHISERDTQVTNNPKLPGEFVNTWSIEGFIEEGIAPSEMGWGTHEANIPLGALFHDSGPCNQICLTQKGINTWARSWVPSGEIIGMVICHGETFGISEHLTVWNETEVAYRPTVQFTYCPCDSAMNSMREFEMHAFSPQSNHRILNDDVIDGKDELGCLLMGHDYQSWWIGTILDIHTSRQLVPNQNATTVQVGIGVVSALIYAINHPFEGFCLPDDLDFREILEVAIPFLGQFISRPVDWNPLINAKAFAHYDDPLPSSDEMWQFSTFLLASKELVYSPSN